MMCLCVYDYALVYGELRRTDSQQCPAAKEERDEVLKIHSLTRTVHKIKVYTVQLQYSSEHKSFQMTRAAERA